MNLALASLVAYVAAVFIHSPAVLPLALARVALLIVAFSGSGARSCRNTGPPGLIGPAMIRRREGPRAAKRRCMKRGFGVLVLGAWTRRRTLRPLPAQGARIRVTSPKLDGANVDHVLRGHPRGRDWFGRASDLPRFWRKTKPTS
jgi:hypothetical protein